MKKLTTIMLVMLLITSTAAFAQMGGGRGGHGMEKGHPGHMMGGGKGHCVLLAHSKILELTEAQITQIKDINFKHQEAMIDVKAELQKARLNKHQQMTSDSPDKGKVLSSTREMSKIKGKMAEMQVEHRFTIREVLTAEQQAKLKEFGMDNQCGKGMGKGCMNESGMGGHGRGHGGKRGCGR
ncbi:MAG: Spy/CpxP family protein refolding chaperone [candidate division Zixibacteria bacterium]|nr:Spy/CpxP family protein refolding chaperone [candidate division Zixibacteria bacterium]